MTADEPSGMRDRAHKASRRERTDEMCACKVISVRYDTKGLTDSGG